jgi:MFS family permease
MRTSDPSRAGTGPDREQPPIANDWRTRLPVFYGWLIVAAAFGILGLNHSVWYSFAVFYVALLEEFGWSRGSTAGVFSLFVLVVGGSGIAVGRLADRLGPGRVLAGGSVILAAGLAACSRITELWHFYFFFGVIAGIGIAASGWVPAVTMLSLWFSRRLGAVAGIASSGIGVGILVMVPTIQWLITETGWRATYLILAATVLAGIFPTALLLMRGRPEELGLLKDGLGPAEEDRQEKPLPGSLAAQRSRVVDREWASRDWGIRAAVHTRRYWGVFAMFSLANIAVQMIFVHQVAYFVDGGYDRLVAASIVGLIGFISIGAKIGWGWVSDRIGRELTYTLGNVFLLLGIALLIATSMVSFPPLIYFYTVAFTLGYAVAPPLGPAVVTDLFAGRNFGSIFGALSLAHGIGSATGAWFAGYVFDVTGSYLLAFGLAIIAAVASTAAVWVAAPGKVRRPPGRV